MNTNPCSTLPLSSDRSSGDSGGNGGGTFGLTMSLRTNTTLIPFKEDESVSSLATPGSQAPKSRSHSSSNPPTTTKDDTRSWWMVRGAALLVILIGIGLVTLQSLQVTKQQRLVTEQQVRLMLWNDYCVALSTYFYSMRLY